MNPGPGGARLHALLERLDALGVAVRSVPDASRAGVVSGRPDLEALEQELGAAVIVADIERAEQILTRYERAWHEAIAGDTSAGDGRSGGGPTR